MSVIVAVRSALLADAAVAALVGTRVYAKKLPQAVTYPAATLELISGDPGNTVAAAGTMKWSRVRINAWGTTYATAEGLAHKIEAALNVKKSTQGAVRLASINAQGLRDFYEPDVEAHYHSQDFSIHYS